MNKIFDIGSWVSTEDGLGQIIFNRELYFEEFSLTSLDVKKGELDRIIYIYKILCDFNGKIKSNNQIKSSTIVNEVNKKEEKLIQHIIKTDPVAYSKYIVHEGNKLPVRQIFLNFKIKQSDVEKVTQKIDLINTNLKSSFTFQEFVKEFKNQDMPFSYKDYYRQDQVYDRSEVISIRFDSFLYRTNGKKSIFTNVSAIKI